MIFLTKKSKKKTKNFQVKPARRRLDFEIKQEPPVTKVVEISSEGFKLEPLSEFDI
jgi:hypothetical protein